jgi:hypothetical protein
VCIGAGACGDIPFIALKNHQIVDLSSMHFNYLNFLISQLFIWYVLCSKTSKPTFLCLQVTFSVYNHVKGLLHSEG